MPTVVLDNGAHTIKVGYAGQNSPAKTIPNYAVRPRREQRLYIGDQIAYIADQSSLHFRRPINRGIVVDWGFEQEVWNRVFSKHVLNVTPKDSTLLVTEPMFNPSQVRQRMDEIVFEHFGFQNYYRTSCPSLALAGYQQQSQQLDEASFGANAALVLDSGYSFTHACPVFGDVPLNYAIRRLEVGGKALASYMKEMVSYRAFDMMNETLVIEDMVRKSCYLSLNYQKDLLMARKVRKSPISRQYILPNGFSRFQGSLRSFPWQRQARAERLQAGDPELGGEVSAGEEDDKQDDNDVSITLNNERISVPELLFTPSDAGIEQAGVAQLVLQSIEASPEPLRPVLWNNVLITGGNANFRQFRSRLEHDLRALAPAECKVRVRVAPDPINASWQGGSLKAQGRFFQEETVSKAEWEEFGSSITFRKFTHD